MSRQNLKNAEESNYEIVEINPDFNNIAFIEYNGTKIYIRTKDSKSEIEDHIDNFSTTEKDQKRLFDESREILDSMIESGITPVFTVPVEFKDDLLKNGLVPHETYIKKTRLLAGTIGVTPFIPKDGKRLIVILKNPADAHIYKIMPRYTGSPVVFRGIVATVNSIPLDKLLIIDSDSGKILNLSDSDSVKIGYAGSKESQEINEISNDVNKTIKKRAA